MELALKVLLSLIIVSAGAFALHWLWKTQIDVSASARKAGEELVAPPSWVATRDQNKIYQNGQEVGDVTGSVTIEGATVTFVQLSNTGSLKRDEAFEYKRLKLKITHVTGTWVMWTSNGATHRDVLKGVKCVIVS